MMLPEFHYVNHKSTIYFFSIVRLNPDDIVPDLIALEYCQVKQEYDLYIPPYGMAFWVLLGMNLPFCQSSY